MIQYTIDEFFSGRERGVKPEFLIEIKYVTKEIEDKNKILEVISNNRVIIQRNINDKTMSKNRKKNRVERVERATVVRAIKPKKFKKSCGEATTKIHVKLNQLSKESFEKITEECIEMINNYEKELIKTELCHILFERIVDGYDYIDMYTEFIRRIYVKSENGKLILRELTETILERMKEIREKEDKGIDTEGEEQVMEKKKCMGCLLFCVKLKYNKVIEDESYGKFMGIIVEREFLYKIIYERIIYEYEYVELYVKYVTRIKETDKEVIEELMRIFYERFERTIKGFEGLSEIEYTEEENIKEKKKSMKVLLFIGQLYNKGVVDYKYVSKYINILKESDNIVYIELLCKMIYISHNKLTDRENNDIETVRDKLANIIKGRQKTKEKNTRIYYEMENVIELQKKKWRNVDLKKLIDNALKGSITESKKKESKKQPEVAKVAKVAKVANVQQVGQRVKISIDDLKIRYNNNTLDIKMSYSIPEENLQELLDELLDECIDQSEKDIIKLSKYCESISKRREIVLKSIETIEKNIEDIRIDVPDIDARIKLFKENINS
jgi:hypothetical protein